MSTPATSLDPRPGVKMVFLTKPFDILDTRRVFVIPAKVHIGGEDSPKEILWVNQTGGPVTIWLPNADKYLNQYEDPRTQETQPFLTPFPVATDGVLNVTVKKDPPFGYY